jgi:TolB protein
VKYRIVALVTLMASLLSVSHVWAQGSAFTGTISKGGDNRIPIAIPDVAFAPGLETEAKEMTNVLVFDLKFCGIFNVLDRSAFPPTFTGFTEDATKINFDEWRKVGVKSLAYVYVRDEGGTLAAECRLFDASSGTQVVGKRFTTQRKFPRMIPHSFSEEITRFTDGTPGVGTSFIVFSAGRSGKKELYISDYDGANAKPITMHNSISIKPKLSPDGAKVVYLSYKDRYPYLYILDLASGKSTVFSKNVGLNSSPAWAPDGKTLALTLSKDANTEIYLKNRDGSNPRRLTNNKSGDTQPYFSPDGSMLTFVSDRTGNAQVFSMNAGGGNETRLSFQGGSSYDPVWSPDGKSIAYVGEKSGEGMEIYVMDAGGTNARRLTESSGANESPTWSPDSRCVMFSSSRTGRAELWAVNATTLEEFQLSKLPAECQGPFWGGRRAMAQQ